MHTSEFAPIHAESTAALVARRLRDLIARGKFAPGQQLFEVELAKRFGVSRGILREALQRLAQEGLLLSRPNRGVFVAEYGPEDVFDIYTARLAVERAACLKVIEVMGGASELADGLDALTSRLEARVLGGGDAAELAWLDIEFHEYMVAAAQSPRLNRMHATLATESRMCSATLENDSYPVDARIGAHREIAQAIRERDIADVHRLLAAHMDHAVGMIVAQLAPGAAVGGTNPLTEPREELAGPR